MKWKAKQRKYLKGYIVYDSNYMTFWYMKNQNQGDSKWPVVAKSWRWDE